MAGNHTDGQLSMEHEILTPPGEGAEGASNQQNDTGEFENIYHDPTQLSSEDQNSVWVNKSGLTIINRSKVEQELHKYEEASHAPSKWLTVAKWLVSILMSLSFTFCMVFSKMGVIYLGHDLNGTNSHFTSARTQPPAVDQSNNSSPLDSISLILAGQTQGPLVADTTLAMIIIVLTLPILTTFLRSLWCGGIADDRPWPSPTAFLVGFLTSVLESIGLSMFVICVLPITPPSVGILLMNGVFLAHAASMLIQTFRGEGRLRYCLAFTLLLSLILSAAGIILTIFCMSCSGGLRKAPAVWAIPVSLICLSLAWCNPLQRLQLMPRITNDFKRKIAVVTHNQFEAKEDGTLHIQLSGDTGLTDSRPVDWDTLVTAFPVLSARWKNSIIICFLKIVLLPAFCLLFAHYFHGEIDLTKLAEAFTRITPENKLFPYFISTIICSFMGYLLGWLACTMSMERLAFALPLSIATPIAFILILWIESCDIDIFAGSSNTASCSLELKNLAFVVPSALCLYVAQLLSTGYYVFKGQSIIMEKESQLFWLPGYNGVFLEQHLLLSRKTKQTDLNQEERLKRARDSRVFICTTMYREAEHEMRELLRSLGRINRSKQQSDRHIQAHIFFDNGVRHKKLTQFALQLVVVAKKALGVRLKECRKVETPYGLQLKWTLPTVIKGEKGMEFFIHLKDNLKVKSKKRWSQIMYMSYVLDYHIGSTPAASDDNTFILTTDADVDFTPASVEALLDLMSRDDKVGAVCARTYPRGSGPVVWYQTFDYAIGHWFQKAANDILGSVLCCPGCFSVYRAEALRHVLPTYASNVTKASEFLTKDMGEDRWLCTLLVQSGWRLEYSAAAENYTYCPEEFDEFFKQRRRWVPSTLANLALLLQEWKTVYYFNNKISIVFLMYQAALLFSTLVSPAVCMLVVSGGVYYAWGVSQYISMTLQYLVCIGYVIVCLWTSPDMQLKVAKLLTVLFAFVMSAVTVGTAVQIVEEHQRPLNTTDPTLEPGLTEVPLPISITTLYLVAIVTMFVVAALLHLPEAYCLIHGLWYLWCLPAGFIILLTYSVVNLTDRSWGTREEKKDPIPSGMSKAEGIIYRIKTFFGCAVDDSKGSMSTQTGPDSTHDDEEEHETFNEQSEESELLPKFRRVKGKIRKSIKPERVSYRFHSTDEPSRVSDWLPGNLREQYANTLENAGYEDTSFLVGLTDQDLQELGIKVKAHRQALLAEIMTLADPEIEPFVPEDIEEWLKVIRLQIYYNNFRKLHIVRGKQLEILKSMSREDIKKELGIHKQGHLKRLLLAIKKLRYPTESEMRQGHVKAKLELLPTRKLKEAERSFWEDLRNERLLPTSSAFSDDFELKDQLTDLRNSSLVVFSVANTIWIILVLTLAPKGQLNVLGTNALGLTFLAIFGFMITVQFLCMIFHRLGTFIHLIARAPPKCGDPYHINWSWTDSGFGKRQMDSIRRHTNTFEESMYQRPGAPGARRDKGQSVPSTLSESCQRYDRIVEDESLAYVVTLLDSSIRLCHRLMDVCSNWTNYPFTSFISDSTKIQH